MPEGAAGGGFPRPDPRTQRESELEEIVAEYLLRVEEGEAPSVEDYLARHPRFAADLAILLQDPVGVPTEPEPWGAARQAMGSEALQSLGDYEILERVAEGGGGVVYRARHAREGHLVALKVLDRRVCVEEREVERFRREARILRALDLVGVVPVYEVGEEGGRLFLAMKWIEGRTVAALRADVQEPGHPLHDFRERARFVARCARILGEVHRHGILHRDVKPSNILLDRLLEPMIIDFGIAREGDAQELTLAADGPMGTPRYLPPEILARGNEAAGAAGDVYGLGLVLYELATGSVAFVQTTRSTLFEQILGEGPLRPRAVEPRLPAALEAVILRATEIDPARRYASMEEFARDLEAVARDEAPSARTLARARPWRRFLVRHRRRLPAAALVLALLVAGGVLAVQGLVRSARRAAWRAEIGPFVGAPFEAALHAGPARMRAAVALARDPAGDEDRFDAAWIHLLGLDFEGAMAALGTGVPGEGPETAALRTWLALLLGQGGALGGHVVAPPGSAGPEAGPSRAFALAGDRSLDLEEDEERLRQRLAPPPVEAARDFLDAQEGRLRSWRGRVLLVAVRWHTLPPPGAARGEEDAAALLRDSAEALAASGATLWGDYYQGVAALAGGDREGAERALARFAVKGPAPELGWHLLAFLRSHLLRKGEAPGAGPDGFARAARAYAEGPARRGQPWIEPLRRLHAAWAFELADAGDLEGLERVIRAWREAVPVPRWQDEVFARLARARALERLDRIEEAAREAHLAARAQDRLALSAAELARLLELLGREADADRALDEAARRPQKAPGSIRAYLLATTCGLRPFSQHQLFGTGFEALREGRAVSGR